MGEIVFVAFERARELRGDERLADRVEHVEPGPFLERAFEAGGDRVRRLIERFEAEAAELGVFGRERGELVVDDVDDVHVHVRFLVLLVD